ncbi:hypothetical protein AaE_015265 [Aphanomyces astaci]|uniref:DUF7769 domain-containing protein n=1 Tax=Aphanomyces astaci TaxID=112090 RepID=A0A6A4Z322_APHAT|nr:hypothetical protein AaE_015265 [Aphanomyces astaci]
MLIIFERQNIHGAISMKDLTSDQRRAVVDHLLLRIVKGPCKLQRGAIQDVARMFGRNRHTIADIWKRANVSLGNGDLPARELVCEDVSSQKKGRVGRKLKYNDLPERIRAVPAAQRTTLSYVAHAIGIPVSTLKDYYKRGTLVKYNSHVKPKLTDVNKTARVKWAMDFVHPTELRFHDMYDYVHVDEKWFNATRVKSRFYLLPGETPPHRTTQSKRFITKVMFLTAVARPRWDDAKSECWDGKIGTWHFTETVPAARSSRNRPAGTLELRPINVTRPIYKKMLIDNVIPAIKAKWPAESSRSVVIQQDNARPHVAPWDAAVVSACTSDGWSMSLKCQPPNSPDLNVLDLGFFRAIQSLQQTHHSNTYQEIVDATNKAWDDVDPWSLERNFLTLQCCLREVIMAAGDNSYKVPHMKKEALKKSGKLPESVMCSEDVFETGHGLLADQDMALVTRELLLPPNCHGLGNERHIDSARKSRDRCGRR